MNPRLLVLLSLLLVTLTGCAEVMMVDTMSMAEYQQRVERGEAPPMSVHNACGGRKPQPGTRLGYDRVCYRRYGWEPATDSASTTWTRVSPDVSEPR